MPANRVDLQAREFERDRRRWMTRIADICARALHELDQVRAENDQLREENRVLLRLLKEQGDET
jgi:hypothetical protein